ncbi:hypothetical protein J2S75_003682 [Ancylobacter polymorphus]|uniref:Uncharacterized protein n=1 Tax=Ancylobacter polymorphus TaxID=223390 RepID=A0ABU0BFL5_9HYPH|nr:hypothetical protein [Ancylobacter polymorphus]
MDVGVCGGATRRAGAVAEGGSCLSTPGWSAVFARTWSSPPADSICERPIADDKSLRFWSTEGMATVFSGKAEPAEAAREGEIDQLHAKIGQRVAEWNFLRRASGR